MLHQLGNDGEKYKLHLYHIASQTEHHKNINSQSIINLNAKANQ